MCRKANAIVFVPTVMEVDVYMYDELDDKAKETAFDNCRDEHEQDDYQTAWEELDFAWQRVRKQVQGQIWRKSNYGSVYKPIGYDVPDGDTADIYERVKLGDRPDSLEMDLCEAYNGVLDENMGRLRHARYVLDLCERWWDEMDPDVDYFYALGDVDDMATKVIEGVFEKALKALGDMFVSLDMGEEDYIGTREWFENRYANESEYTADGVVFDEVAA